VICGVVKGLGRQNHAMYINFVTYYIFALPLGYYFCFYYSSSFKVK